MIFYLSGGMEYKKGLGVEWRSWLTEKLTDLKHSTVDPTKLEEDSNLTGPAQKHITQLKMENKLEEVRKIVRTVLFRKDIWGIKVSDALIVLYDESVQQGAGTLAETWEAFRLGKPIYLISYLPLEKIPSWLIGETIGMFGSFDEFLTYVSNLEQLKVDTMEAQKIAKGVFEGI